MKQRVIDEEDFYNALNSLDILSVELTEIQQKIKKVKQAVFKLQKDLHEEAIENEHK